jgi:hypothetical protein
MACGGSHYRGPAKDFPADLRRPSACPARAADGQQSSQVRVGKIYRRHWRIVTLNVAAYRS